MYQAETDIEKKQEFVLTITYNWCLIRLCYEMWKEDIYSAWGNEKVKLHEIVGVGVNYVNELCNGKRVKAGFIYIPEGQKVIQDYLMGVKEFSFTPSRFKEYVVINNLYNILLNRKRKPKADDPQEAVEREKELLILCKGNENISEYIENLKKKCIGVLQKQPLTTIHGAKNSLGLIKDYLCRKTVKGNVIEKEKELLVSFHKHTMDWNCETIAAMSNKSLKILYEDVTILFDRVKAEKYYRDVREMERYIRSKEREITTEQYLKDSEADVGETEKEDKDVKKKETKTATEKN